MTATRKGTETGLHSGSLSFAVNDGTRYEKVRKEGIFSRVADTRRAAGRHPGPGVARCDRCILAPKPKAQKGHYS